MRSFFTISLSLLLILNTLTAQTAVDLKNQSKNIDFSTAAFTKPFKSGVALPATCSTGELFFKTDAPANVYVCTAPNGWTPQSPLAMPEAVRVNNTTLRIGANCSIIAACNIRFGNVVFSFTNGATITLSGNGTGTVFVYATEEGSLVAASNTLSLTCGSGCLVESGVTGFPFSALPLFRWTVTNGIWDLAGGSDLRSALSVQLAGPGMGLQAVEALGRQTFGIDSAIVATRVGVPSTAVSAGMAGTWALDSTHYYVCVATNVWRRTAVSPW